MTSTEGREPSGLAMESLSRVLGDVRRYPVKAARKVPIGTRIFESQMRPRVASVAKDRKADRVPKCRRRYYALVPAERRTSGSSVASLRSQAIRDVRACIGCKSSDWRRPPTMIVCYDAVRRW